MSAIDKESISTMPVNELKELAEGALDLFLQERALRNKPVERPGVAVGVEDGTAGIIFQLASKEGEKLQREISAHAVDKGVRLRAIVFEISEIQYNEAERRGWKSDPWVAPNGLVRDRAHFAGIIGALYDQAMVQTAGDLRAVTTLTAKRASL